MNFEWKNKSQSVNFIETEQVTKGVEYNVYSFIDGLTKDLGIIRIQPGFRTPLQKVLLGEKTIEGYVSGKGTLLIIRANSEEEIHEVSNQPESKFETIVNIGNLMQWQAATDSHLTAYEICFPPYKDGRYEEVEQFDLK